MLKQIRSFFRVLKSRDDFERGMSEELRFHIDQYMADLIRAGVPPPEAARRARIEFGSLNSTQEECREARGLQPFDELRRQLRHAGRTLRKTPRFTATALLTLAVCLGANLTIFAVVDSILLRPLPFPGARPAGHGVQHISESRRPPRWVLNDELLRTPRSDTGLLGSRHLQRGNGNRRRNRRNRTRAVYARIAGVFLHPWR